MKNNSRILVKTVLLSFLFTLGVIIARGQTNIVKITRTQLGVVSNNGNTYEWRDANLGNESEASFNDYIFTINMPTPMSFTCLSVKDYRIEGALVTEYYCNIESKGNIAISVVIPDNKNSKKFIMIPFSDGAIKFEFDWVWNVPVTSFNVKSIIEFTFNKYTGEYQYKGSEKVKSGSLRIDSEKITLSLDDDNAIYTIIEASIEVEPSGELKGIYKCSGRNGAITTYKVSRTPGTETYHITAHLGSSKDYYLFTVDVLKLDAGFYQLKTSNNQYNRTITTTMKIQGKLRSSDSPTSSIIRNIPKDATVRVIGNKGHYWKVFYQGKTGYLNEMYLNITYEMTTLQNNTNSSKVTNVTNSSHSEITTMKIQGKLRSSDSPTSSIIKHIPKNATVRVIENKGHYWKVFYDGKTGYLNEMYLNITYSMTLMK